MSSDLKAGMRSSKGDPKVLFVLNVALSATFAFIVLYLSDLVGITELTWSRFLGLTAILVVLTFIVTWD
ncbi:hypothetical protein [Natronobeatus ordinarius]|uniref:hypothetical protein n=1 Tax=Natronobeatus ordinarius TaxID=2963433 RepID=UPI0020CE6062|nr:hypothetical protein [Natronobeatus ordinarius]